MKLQSINQSSSLNSPKNKNVNFQAHERFVVENGAKVLANYCDYAGKDSKFSNFDNLGRFISFVLENHPRTKLLYQDKPGANIVVGQFSGFTVQNGNAFDILTDSHLKEATSFYHEDALGKDLFYSALSSKHIHSVNSPGEVLMTLEEKMPELGVTYNGYKHFLTEWSKWLISFKKGETTLLESPLYLYQR